MEIKDMNGRTFGRLTVVGLTDERQHGTAVWECRCSCGEVTRVKGSRLRAGSTTSCGCFQREASAQRATERLTSHGLSRHPLYRIHYSMMSRCCDPENFSYANYGGRGISVHKPWQSVDVFIKEIESTIGPRPPDPAGWKSRGAYWTLDRINNDGNYEPGNVRWADHMTQRHNARQDRGLVRLANGRYASGEPGRGM